MGGQNMFLWIVQLVMFAGLGLGQLRLRCLERRRLHLVRISIPKKSMHYGAAVKWGQKWPTLTNYFSMDFDHRVPKIGTHLPQLPNY